LNQQYGIETNKIKVIYRIGLEAFEGAVIFNKFIDADELAELLYATFLKCIKKQEY